MTDTGRRRAVLAGVVVLLALVTVAVLLVAGREQSPTAQAPTPSATTEPAATATATATASGGTCDPAPASEEIPTAPPEDLGFEVVGRGIVPVSDTYGPTVRTAPAWDCFSRSPMGAVMAATSISTLRVVGEDLVAIGEQQLVENQGQQVYLDFVRDLGSEGVTTPAEGLNQPAGFRIDSFTRNQAVVSLADRTGDGALSASALTVVWQDGTWKLQLLDDGSETAALTPLIGLDDYVAWGL